MHKPIKKDHPILRVYHLTALCISGIGVLILFDSMLTFHSHPVGGFIGAGLFGILFLGFIAVGALLLHSFIVSVIYTAKIQPRSYWGLIVHLIYLLILFSFSAWP